MIWDERYRIGDGEKTTDETAPAVYRSYPECGITITEELFNLPVFSNLLLCKYHNNIYKRGGLLG